MRHAMLTALILVVTAPVAWAQSPSSPGPDLRNAVSGALGAGQTWDDEGSLGSGVLAGARFERRLFGTTAVELGVDLLTHDRDVGYFQAEGTTTLLSASLVHRFGRRAAQPYVLGGLHLALHDGRVSFSDFPERDENSTDVGFPLGAGLAVRVGERYEIGPEFRILGMWVDDDSNPATALWVGIRVGYRF
jgi:opacity protein-like surface antigen